jgi:LCP family protein required for cell wall assembly
MADRPRPDPAGRDEPAFDWLYGTRSRGVGSSGAGADEPTQAQPRVPRDPEPTQRLPTIDRPGERPRDRAAARAAYQSPAPARDPRPPTRPPARPTSPGGSGGRGGRRRFRPRPRWIGYLLVLWVAFLVVVPILAWNNIDKVAATPSGDRPATQGGTTYLLVGSDSRAGLTRKEQLAYGVGKAQGRRTDSIMLLHTGAGPNLLMSIPRDSLVPGHGTTKINAAFAFGGPRLLTRTIEQNTGIRIDDYVEIGFAGFVDVVDAVGGVRICPQQAMKDRLADLDVKKGCQDVDGKVALGYARSRHVSGLGDIARAQHQREVVSAVGRKAASPWTVVNPFRYWRLAMAGSHSVRVGKDTGLLASVRFAWAMTRVNGSNGLTCAVPIRDLAVHWDPVRSKRLFAYVKENRTSDIPQQLCRQSGLPGGS